MRELLDGISDVGGVWDVMHNAFKSAARTASLTLMRDVE